MMTDDEPRKARDAWNSLRYDDEPMQGGGIPTRRALKEGMDIQVHFALTVSGEGRLLLPLPRGESIPPALSSDAVEFSVINLRSEVNRHSGRFVDVTCRQRGLEGAFADVCDHVVERIHEGGAVMHSLVTTFEEFAELFRSAKEEEQGVGTVRGLLGELIYLQRLLALDSKALLLWRGFTGESVDFRGGSTAVEIKTTGKPADSQITISSLDQLTIPPKGTLSLRLYNLPESEGGELAIPEIVASIEECVHDVGAFREALAAVGCEDPNMGAWGSRRFMLHSARQWAVEGTFPRLTRDDLPSDRLKIEQASYQIRPEVAVDYLMDEVSEEMVMKEMTSCLMQ